MPVDLSGVEDREIDGLASELGGLDFSHAERRAFLRRSDACDVQAAPGAGKTTLLAAKLELVARRWRPGDGAVAIVSHTNVARHEIERRLSGRVGSASLLRYPHFVGTLTRFVHEHVTLPALRGLGWQADTVDDELHLRVAGAILCRSSAKPWISQQSRLQGPRTSSRKLWDGACIVARSLVLDASNELKVAPAGNLVVRSSPTFQALQQAKDSLTARGIFTYQDMLAIALFTLRGFPRVAEAVAERFPLIILDEAQDTGPTALEILEELRRGGATVQRLGDVNQTIYAFDDDAVPWAPSGGVIDVGESLRFGPCIASFASAITPFRAQQMAPRPGADDAILLILYAEGQEREVIPAFAREAAGRLGVADGELWAVGHRMNASEGAAGLQLVVPTYCPGARTAQKLNVSQPESLLDAVRSALVTAGGGVLTRDAPGLVIAGIARLLEVAGVALDNTGRRCTATHLMRKLSSDTPHVARALRGWTSEVLALPPNSQAEWTDRVNGLLEVLGTLGVIDRSVEETEAFLSFDVQGYDSGPLPEMDRVTVSVGETVVTVRVGTIASIKGQTHDATLVLDTVFKRMYTVRKAVKHALGIAKKKKALGPDEQKVLANVYVAATRPRRLLALACCRDALDETEREAALARGWQIIEVTGAVPSNA